MGNNITYGDELSVWKTIAIGVAESKNLNNNNKKSKYAVFKLSDASQRGVAQHNHIIWDDDDPELIKVLWDLKIQDPEDATRFIVPLSAVGCKVVTKGWGRNRTYDLSIDPEVEHGEMLADVMIWPGARLMPMALRNGECYLNDADGKPRYRKGTNEPLTATHVNVFVIVDHLEPGPDGNMVTVYKGAYNPQTQLKRIEDRFFKNPVPKSGKDPVDDNGTAGDVVDF